MNHTLVPTQYATASTRHADRAQGAGWTVDFQLMHEVLPPLSAALRSAIQRKRPFAARHLTSFTRNQNTICRQDWIFSTMGDLQVVGRIISEIAQLQHAYIGRTRDISCEADAEACHGSPV